MFERFTGRARHVVVIAQDEARGLHHNYIGTEHLLLGLLRETEGVAGRALARFGITLPDVRQEIRSRIGTGPPDKPPKGHIPFTPRAKKVMELALREALSLRHNYIGTEHLLLGLIREGDGVGAQILSERADGGLPAIRTTVIDLLPVASQPSSGRRWLRRRTARIGESDEPGEAEELRTTPATDVSLDEAARLAGPDPVGSHHLLLATLADPDSAAARALATLGVDLDHARQALRDADVAGTSDEQPEEAGRRHMTVRVSDGLVTIEARDPAIVAAGGAAVAALGGAVEQPGAFPGSLPVAVSLGTVWEALRDSLEDIKRRASAAQPAADGPADTA